MGDSDQAERLVEFEIAVDPLCLAENRLNGAGKDQRDNH